jgi:hypothetical protein
LLKAFAALRPPEASAGTKQAHLRAQLNKKMDEPPYTCEIPETPAKDQGYSPLDAAAGSPLADAMALIALGPQRSANAVDWCRVSLEMCKHCEGAEDVNEAAARILSQRMKKLENALKILKGDIDSLGHWIPDPCRRLVDDALANGQGQESPGTATQQPRKTTS